MSDSEIFDMDFEDEQVVANSLRDSDDDSDAHDRHVIQSIMSSSSDDDDGDTGGNSPNAKRKSSSNSLKSKSSEPPKIVVAVKKRRRGEREADERRRMREWLQRHTCYELMPPSGKIVVLDNGLTVKSALRAMRENGMSAAPLWDGEKHDYVGMLAVTDWMDMLRHFYSEHRAATLSSEAADESRSMPSMLELEASSLKQCRELIAGERMPKLMSVDPESSAFAVCECLIRHKIHRAPLLDREQNVILAVLTHRIIVRFLMANIAEIGELTLIDWPVGELGIGTFGPVATCLLDTPLIGVLHMLSSMKISALPVVDERGVVVDVYSKADVMALVKFSEPVAQLDRPLRDIIAETRGQPAPIHTCSKRDTLRQVLTKLLAIRAHRLMCVDADMRIEGIVSLSDIMSFILQPMSSDSGADPMSSSSSNVSLSASPSSMPRHTASTSSLPADDSQLSSVSSAKSFASTRGSPISSSTSSLPTS
jgi:5'-AMP-activated protein kinase, regulatory gamma subunit